MNKELITEAYELAKKRYAEFGVDTEKVVQQMAILKKHCRYCPVNSV